MGDDSPGGGGVRKENEGNERGIVELKGISLDWVLGTFISVQECTNSNYCVLVHATR